MSSRFAIVSPRTWEEAAGALKSKSWRLPILKAGGMDVLDHLKEGLIEPDALIDVKRITDDAGGSISYLADVRDRDEIRISANTTLAQIASDSIILQHFPALAQASESAATPQVRNVATLAGNLLQRPRCWYYRQEQFNCLKKGGDTCFAIDGENRYHAIFGTDPCRIVHPSNLAMALFVTDSQLRLAGGERDSIQLSDLYHMPGKGIRSEHNLAPGEVVTEIHIEPAPASAFYAIKEKQSFDWPVVVAAAAIKLNGSTISHARVCAGAVAPVPWPLPDVEKALVNVNLDDAAALKKACDLAANGASPLRDNAYKVKLLPVAVRRAILRAAGRPLHD